VTNHLRWNPISIRLVVEDNGQQIKIQAAKKVIIPSAIHPLKIPFEIRDPTGASVPRFVYAYLIYGEEIALIDSGVASSERIIFDHLRGAGRSPEEISRLILTHAHPDHMGAARAVKEASGCSVACHPADKGWIEDICQQLADRPVPGFEDLVAGSVGVDEELVDGDRIDLGGGRDLEVIHTPGHSPGSISLWMAEGGVLFSADAIPLPGGMPIYDDLLSSVQSVRRLRGIEGVRLLLSAWDDPRSGAEARRIIDEGLLHLQRIHAAVIRVAGSAPSLDRGELCRRTLRELGLPEAMANPLTCRSFASSLELLHRRDLLKG